MTDNETRRILNAAARLRPHLPADDATELDALSREIEHRPTAALLDQVIELVGRDPDTRHRLRNLLATGTDGERTTMPYGPLEGDPTSDYDRWVCAKCGYAFPVIDADDPVPAECPNDRSPLTQRLAGS
jgi:rubrerythrin